LLATPWACTRPGTDPHFEEITLATDFHWASEIPLGQRHLSEMIGGAVAIIDHDGDGDMDLWLVQSAAATGDTLLENQLEPSGRLEFRDVTAEVGLGGHCSGTAIATGDIDRDGDLDVFRGCLDGGELWVRNGSQYTDGTQAAGLRVDGFVAGATFVDFDADGWLDLFVTRYAQWSPAVAMTCRSPAGRPDFCGPLAWPPSHDLLFRNQGNGRFVDISEHVGLHVAPSTGLAIAALYRGGGEAPMIYVANDQRPNQLWQLRDGALVDRAEELGVAVSADGRSQASMGIAVVDLDSDCGQDLFVTHLVGDYTTFYRDLGPGGWADSSIAVGLAAGTRPFTSWGVVPLDVDGDGDLDLVTTNGEVRVIDAQVAEGWPIPVLQQPLLLLNHAGRLEPAPPPAGSIWTRLLAGRGLARGDLDNDGALDLVIASLGGSPLVLRGKRSNAPSQWIGLDLRTPVPGGSTTPAIGASATLETNGSCRKQWTTTDGSYAAAHDPRLVFSLGPQAPTAVTVQVEWIDGRVESFGPLETGQWHTLIANRTSGQAAANDP
jgi:hypothetical protein